jgi:oxygen-independent coproporphyrinogen-3 oxidase
MNTAMTLPCVQDSAPGRLDPGLLESLAARYDRAGPRYTSYPTAVQFTEEFGPADYRKSLQDASLACGEPWSIYIHVPFCARRCTYCGCQVIPTRKRSAADDYLDHLEMEIELVAGMLGERRRLKVLHLGGGTPTFLTPEELERLFAALARRFPACEGAEVSVELDPRATTDAHLKALRARGVNRVSVGVQDLTPEVQQAIGRDQTVDQTIHLYRMCREARLQSINFDLVYGLPRQTVASFERSLRQIVLLRPDRVAMYGYAHVPWMKSQQRTIDPATLPTGPERLRMFLRAGEIFAEAGYLPIGMDHFALPHDDLAAASRSGRLGRNFMGYTPHDRLGIIGLGLSSIGQVAGSYVQNQKKLSTYYRMLEEGTLPVERGYRCTADDEVRRYAIHQLLSNLRLELAMFESKVGIRFEEYFQAEVAGLRDSERDGLIQWDRDAITVTPLGRCFVRNVVMALDRHNRGPATGGPKFSRTV